MTIHLIDRYLQIVDVSKYELQLIGSTGMRLYEIKIVFFFFIHNDILW